MTQPFVGGRLGARARFCPLLAACIIATWTGLLPMAGAAIAAPAACGPSFSDRLVETPWPLRRLRPDLVWPVTSGAGVTVAVIDSGVSTSPPSLLGQVLPGVDFVDPGGAGDCDQAAHGTFVAGIIAGLKLPGTGFYGVAPGAKILPIRVLRDDKKSFDDNLPTTIAKAIEIAVQRKVQVINLSLVTEPTPALTTAVTDALAHNVVVVAAAGNDGASQGGPAYPAVLNGVIAVAGIDQQDQHVASSTSGDYVDVAGPGVQIQGPAPQGGGFGTRPSGGTSFAAAYVSGVAALIRAYDPSLTAAQVSDRITTTADHPPDGHNAQVGFGMVNPYRAVATITADGGAPENAPESITPADGSQDPLDTPRTAAIWIAGAGAAITAAVWTGIGLSRRVRPRRWPAGQLAGSTAPPRDRFSPEAGSAMTVSGPIVRRDATSREMAAIERRGVSMPTASPGNRL